MPGSTHRARIARAARPSRSLEPVVAGALLLVACAPKIDRGPVPVERAAAPVPVLEQPDPAAPMVHLQATIAAGSAHDPVGAEGLAHLTARSVVEAGAGERSAEQVRDALARTGAGFDVEVDRELVTVRLSCPVAHQAPCAELFTDALVRPRFDEADVARLRDEALHTVTVGLLADEAALGGAVLEAVIYEAHPYAHPPEGRAGVLPLLGRARVADFHARHWVREAMWVGIAGDYAPETVEALRAGLQAAPSTMAPELVLLKPLPVEGRSLTVVDTGAETTTFHLGHPLAVTRDHPDWPALHLALAALGARDLEPALPGDVRRQPHLAIGLRPTPAEGGPLALKRALADLEGLVARGLSAEELADARDRALARLARLAGDPGGRLACALEAVATGTPSLLELGPALEGLPVEEVNDAIRRHLDPRNLRIVATTGDPGGLARALVEDGSAPIVYAEATQDVVVAKRDAEVADDGVKLSPEAVWTLQAEGIFR